MKKFLGISLILIIGLILRLICINKVDGLWNDEYVSWMISAIPFKQGFFEAIKNQCHMPFYYLYLKAFMTLFGQSDLALRLSSVFTGILSIIAMYFVGLEKDKKTGLFCAGFCAISSFLIYFSQEVRLYSILFLFSSLNLLFTIRILKKTDLKNVLFYLISNAFILLTHTIGFVYVFFNLLLVSICLFKHFKKIILTLWTVAIVNVILCFPLVFKIFTTQSFSQWWGHFSISKIFFLFTDYFSPVLTNLTNAPDNIFYAPKLFAFMLIPTLIAIYGIIKALKFEKLNLYLLISCILTLLIIVIASLSGKLVFITKYTIEIYPILIYLACSGLAQNNKFKNFLIAIYILISLGYIIFHPYSAPKIRRAEGHKIAADLIKNTQLKQGDFILLEYYNKERFEKYFDFSKYNTVSINKGNFNYYLTDNTTYQDAYKNGKNLYKNIFLTDDNEHFNKMLEYEILDKLQPGQSVAMLILESVAYISPDRIKLIAKDKTSYDKEPLLFLVFSYVKKEAFFACAKKLSVTRIEKKGSWTVVKFTKLND